MVNAFPTPPKVFISYSHDSQEHKDRVLNLADRLRSDGIDCKIDQYEESPAQGWPRWMLNQLEWADFVLVVGTQLYNRRFRGEEEPGRGKGVTWEGAVISQELYDAQVNSTKFIPVIFADEDGEYIPIVIRGFSRYTLDSEAGYENLYRRLTNQHDTPQPELGELRTLPLRDRQQSFFEEQKSQPVDNQHKTKSMSANFFVYDDRTWVGRNSLINDLNSRVRDSCRLLILVGITGIGKTALGERLTIELEDWFNSNWDSYLPENFDKEEQSSDFASVAARLLEKAGEVVTPDDRKDTQRLLNRLVKHLQENRYLIQIDSLEKILQGSEEDGWSDFKDDWWIKFFDRWLNTNSCKSCIILTSQDFPAQIDPEKRFENFWHYQLLSGLEKPEQLALFGKTGLDVSSEAEGKPYLERIGTAYEGHPLALKVIAGEIINRPFNGNVLAYWNKYGNEVEEVEKAIESAKSEGATVGADDQYNLHQYTRSLRRNVKSRLENTYKRLRTDVRNAYLLICESSVYRCEVSENFWLSHLEDWDIDEEGQEKALNTLRDRYLVEELINENNQVMLRQHNLIRGVSLEHLRKLDQLDEEEGNINNSSSLETSNPQQKNLGNQEINYQIFSDLSSDDVIKLETALQNVFRQFDSVAGRKSIFTSSGINDIFIDNLDFNLKNSEFIAILTSNLLTYKVSSQDKHYHPMMVLVDYIIKQHQKYNLDDSAMEIFNRIVIVGKDKIQALFP
ncbi:MAG: TIR domain-containing protein [Calothrix sp. MO_167.B12]|nr:TIR domain-containing protein [Calothrix sp. MO_167.B12]